MATAAQGAPLSLIWQVVRHCPRLGCTLGLHAWAPPGVHLYPGMSTAWMRVVPGGSLLIWQVLPGGSLLVRAEQSLSSPHARAVREPRTALVSDDPGSPPRVSWIPDPSPRVSCLAADWDEQVSPPGTAHVAYDG